jgi:hypothetical protein
MTRHRPWPPDTLDAQILTKLTTRGCRTIGTTDDKTFTGSLTYRGARNAAEIWVTSRSTTTSSPFRALELIEHREEVGAHLLPGAAAEVDLYGEVLQVVLGHGLGVDSLPEASHVCAVWSRSVQAMTCQSACER